MDALLQSQRHLSDVLAQVLQIQTTQAAPTPIIVPPAVHPPKVKLPLPDEYDGTPDKYDTFIRGVRAHLSVPSNAYTTPALQILFTLSLMKKGLAATWANEKSQAIHDGTYQITTWDAFEAVLQATFRNPFEEQDAKQEMKALEQGSLSAVEYFVKCDLLKVKGNIDDRSACEYVETNLRKGLAKIIIERGKPVNYGEWRERAIKLDHDIKSHDALRTDKRNDGSGRGNQADSGRRFAGGQRTTFPAPPMAPTPNQAPGPNVGQGRGSGTPGGGQIFGGQGEPMDLSRSRGRGPGPPRCYKCQQLGHLARNCPQNVREMWERSGPDEKKVLIEELRRMKAEAEGANEGDSMTAPSTGF
ncbi:hypothetical protein BU15DRAFT_42369 [Melanogaster broomeanus]|nr:hypothetical protein BU15DRAFT_42369 [Melanogaster broomeanus]